MVLIANKKSNIESIKDIKDKKYVSYINSGLSNIWLDYRTRKVFKKDYKKIIKKEHKIKKSSRRILEVYFGKSDFTITKKDTYEDMLMLNPSLANKLKIVDESKAIFYYMIGFFHKKTDKDVVDAYDKIINYKEKSLSQIYKSVEIFNLYNSSFEELEEMEKFYDEYIELVKKTNN